MLHKDADILRYEPALFGNAMFTSQTLGKGANGVLTGTAFTATGGNFTSLGLGAGSVIFLQSLDGVINGAYEITAVVSATALTISVLRADSGDRYLSVAQCAQRPKVISAKPVPTKPRAKPVKSSECNKNFDLKKAPKIWQAAQASSARPETSV